ncbi:ROK family protein [Heyndrickxia sporothermodurans]|uniref:ROK family protein n=1 Tax=Heyndrickxia sporothermodurans TaxID=46224 RepID=A0AB37HHZ8_9BACI|nr:ROK family protein [Heyndrickxia sporothermodurans]MBL5768281.1 ROK family protein [Heyndrickxia sporothermodurans]MBL5771905.1 ROK family protein [Heyndrickxia sporothermodurans]MBL5775525.1 ROK family protein [Heyndrickxia sporothermodurans]MBL5778980.1 ROK family protein [Heyndrickxia sporothermodurans]MBL5782977.1 ROK family protein [Heyndrickxia sporothermodurans]
MKQYISFDIGGTDTKYAVLDENGTFLQKGKFPTNRYSGQSILNRLIEITNEHVQLSGIALSVPGFVNVNSGFIEVGGAISDFNQFNIKDYLEKELQLPVSVENDVNCVALAEKWKGNAQHETDFLCMTIGTGIGGACYLNNQLYRGSSYMAGEFGYMITNGLQNNTVGRCTLSSTGGLWGLRERFAHYKGVAVEEVSGLDVFEAYEKGDPHALHEVNQFYDSLSIAIYNLFFLFNPNKILLGGAISQRDDLINELTWRIQRLPSYRGEVPIECCYLKNDAGVLGALYHHFETYQLLTE